MSGLRWYVIALSLVLCSAEALCFDLRADVDRLASLEDRMSKGDVGAAQDHSYLLSRVGRDISLHPAVASAVEQREFFLVFLLSGGDIPQPPFASTKANALDGLPEGLMAHIIAVLRGDTSSRKAFLEVDPMNLSSRLGARVALAQSAIDTLDPVEALARLQTVELLAPGTLLEETALRRSIFLHVRTGDHVAAAAAWTRWVKRFPKSMFQGRIVEQIADALRSNKSAPRDLQAYFALTAMLPATIETQLLSKQAYAAFRGQDYVALRALTDRVRLRGSDDGATRAQMLALSAVLHMVDGRFTDADSLASQIEARPGDRAHSLAAAVRGVIARVSNDSASGDPVDQSVPQRISEVRRLLTETSRLLDP
jgi:chemotaxis protein MotC